MTTPHPHAEFIAKHVTGEDTSDYEAAHNEITQRVYMPAADHAMSIFCTPAGWKVRRKPTHKVIDWSKLGSHVPVAFFDIFGRELLPGFLDQVDDGIFIDRTRCAWNYASLDTGLWVFNHDGVNPWPEGCVVQIRFESRSQGTFPASESHWGVGGADRIIASRFHSLEDGYSFGGDS